LRINICLQLLYHKILLQVFVQSYHVIIWMLKFIFCQCFIFFGRSMFYGANTK